MTKDKENWRHDERQGKLKTWRRKGELEASFYKDNWRHDERQGQLET
jgi:hypothetical protein